MNYSDKAVAFFMRGYNCSQSTAAAFAEDFVLSLESVLALTAGFGGGIGGLRETCGALSGMVFVAGLHAGSYPPGDLEAKTRLYDLVKEVNRNSRKGSVRQTAGNFWKKPTACRSPIPLPVPPHIMRNVPARASSGPPRISSRGRPVWNE